MTNWRRPGLIVVAVAVAIFFSLRYPPRIQSQEIAPPPAPPALPPLAANDPPAVAPASMPDSPDRVADARARRGAHLAQICDAGVVVYPPRAVYLRAFKREGVLELWACSEPAGAPFHLVTIYPILRASGRLGPKRCEGDGQVPEGFYMVNRFNPRSLFHLSLGLDYPNAADRRLTTDPEHPGTDIFIHGDAVSVGCLAMGDAVAEELYLTVSDTCAAGKNNPAVHIFPCRMNDANWKSLLAPLCEGQPELRSLWLSLGEGYNRFERTRQVPVVSVETDGRYSVE